MSPQPGRATVAWALRMVRRSSLLIGVSVAAYMWLEVASFHRTYPDGVSADQFAIFSDNPAARMLQGVPHGVDSAGGFAAWDGGWMLEIIVGFWALLTVTRLLRGEEETDRAELLLVGPIRAGRATGLTLLVVMSATLLFGAMVALALAASGSDVTRATIFGLGIAGFAATFVGVGAISAQVVDVRRRAAALAAGVFGLTFVLRMVASSTDEREWIGWLTPFGWMDQLEPFGTPSMAALVALLVTPALLSAVAVAVRRHRDTGRALIPGSDSRSPRMLGLKGPAAFAWRSSLAQMVGWTAGLAAYSFVIGSLLTTTIEFIRDDENYQRVMAELGMDIGLDVSGFLGVMGVTVGIGFALYTCWRMGAARTEEETGRAENLFSRPVTRQRWLLVQAGVTLVGALIVTVLSALALWAGAVSTGADDVTLADTLGALLNTSSVVVLVTGLAVLTFGLLPRLTLAVPATVTVASYVLSFLGPALSWPQWAVDLSPFTHLAYVPAEPYAATAAAVMALLGCAAGIGGVVAFDRRDLKGA